MKKTLREIATLVNGKIIGDEETEICGLSDIEHAAAGDLIFAVPPHIDEAKNSKCSAVLLPEAAEIGDVFPLPAVLVRDPRAAFALLMTVFLPQIALSREVSPKAHIGKNVKIGKNTAVMPFAVVDDNAEIGDNATIYPNAYIGQFAKVGDGTTVYSAATVREYCIVGKNCIIHSAAVIGADGFGFTTDDGVHKKVPQIGNVILGDNVEIGAHVGIDRATINSTVVGNGTKIDNLVHIGHNCKIGDNCLIVAQTGISGSTIVGNNVTFGGQVGTVGHIEIGANSVYAARSGITGNMPENYFGAGFPVQPHAEWLRMQAAMKKMPELVKKIRALEKALASKKEK